MDLEAQAQVAYDAAEAKDTQDTGAADAADTTDATNAAQTGDGDQQDDQGAQDTQDTGEADQADAADEADKTGDEADTADEADKTDKANEADDSADQKPPFDPNSSLESFVYEGLPDITVTGKDGKEYSVKVPEELPENFEFKNARDEQIFGQQMYRQQQNAEKLVGDYNVSQQQALQQSYNQNLRSEIDSAVKSGRIPKFDGRKINPEGAGEKRAQQVLDYMNQANESLAKSGKLHRIQSFEQALDLLEAKEAREQLAKYQASIDQGKKDVASLTPGSSQSGGGSGGNKPAPMPRNMSATDFVSALDAAGEL